LVTRAPRHLLRVCGLALLTAALAPASAFAHATVQSTTPVSGAVLKAAPAQVVFHYDESVEGTFGAVRVYNAKGARVDSGGAFHPAGRGSLLGVRLEPRLPRGAYTATYRVVSADGHIVSGGFVFSVGSGSAAPPRTVAALLGHQKTGTPTEIAFGAARAIQYGAIAIGVGGLAFLFIVWLAALRAAAGAGRAWQLASSAFARRLRWVIVAAALAGALSALVAVDLEAAEAAGVSGWSALSPHVMREVLGTRFGMVWTAAAGAWLLLGLLAGVGLAHSAVRAPALRPASVGATGLAMPSRLHPAALAAAIPALFLVLVPAFSGHGTTQKPVAVLFPSIVVHVAAMTLWLGGLVALLVAVPAATRRLDGPDRARLLAGVLTRFSRIALAAVVVLLATGVLQGFEEVRHLHLLTSTGFGRAVLIKFCLLLALIGLGAVNRRRTVPRIEQAARAGETPGAAGLVLRRTLRAEVALIAVVLGVTGALASYAPAVSKGTGPFSITTKLGPEQLQMTVDPARVGPNEMHLYLISARTGAQFTGAKELNVEASQTANSIGPLTLRADHTGPGHYTVAGALLSVPGTWTLHITARVSEFDEYMTTIKVPIR
jgi:copper transport protein